MLRHEAVFRFVTGNAERISRAIGPELSDEVNPRSETQFWIEGDDTLVLQVRAEDTAALRAALNMFLRLVNVADEVQELAGKKN